MWKNPFYSADFARFWRFTVWQAKHHAEILQQVLEDIYSNWHNYQEWLMDIVADYVGTWNDNELENHLGIIQY